MVKALLQRSAPIAAVLPALLIGAGSAWAQVPTVTAVPGKPVLPVLSGFGPGFSPDVAAFGYAIEEYFISGTAASYQVEGTLPANGKWNAVAADAAPYTTRIFVVRPTDARKFNGTVVVEWINVTPGTDVACDWAAVHRELLRDGYAYVGISAQKAGIDGFATPPAPAIGLTFLGLKKDDPTRYEALNHPGDAFSYDIYSQAGQVIRAASTNKILGPLVPKRVLAMGESQSAVRLTTYINAADPLAKVYDGFLVHSRFGGASPLHGEAMAADTPRFVQFRSDLRVPVIAVEAESDVRGTSNIAGYYGARVPDNDKLRVWEVAGAAHADVYTFTVGGIDTGMLPLETLAAAWAPKPNVPPVGLAKPINNARQHHYVVEAALANLDRWVRTGTAPAKAEPMKTEAGRGDAPPRFVLDANGLVEGGVRTPWVDVPTERLSGTENPGHFLGSLLGSTEPFDAATLDRLYPGGKSEYLKKFEALLDAAIRSGFILAADREEIMGLASLMYHGSH